MRALFALVPIACVVEEPDSEILPPEDSAVEVPVDATVPLVVSSTPCDACGGDCLVEELAYASRSHTTEPIAYASTPPAGGPHHPCWTTWGVHTDAVEDEHWVHNLEHGGVVFAYTCVDCAEDVAALTSFAEAVGEYVVVVPYAQMQARYAAVAWGWRLTAACYDEAAFDAFYVEHVDRGPESTMSAPGEGCM